jgi:hypothetical protein
MTRTIACFAAALALTVSPAAATPRADHPVAEFSAAKRAKPHRPVRVAPQRKIACTVFGCHPVPRGCTPVTGFDFWGNPTDYDDVVCR